MITISTLSPTIPVSILIDSPHSGRDYPADFNFACRPDDLRHAEDAWLDQMILPLAREAHLIWANFPRSYIDVNRAVDDIDPAMLRTPIAANPSAYSHNGVGLLHRDARPGRRIYNRLLTVAEVKQRIQSCYIPYYQAVEAALAAINGEALYLNIHSMPSLQAPADDQGRPYDLVLGTLDGAAADHDVVRLIVDCAEQAGFSVGIDVKYKGGHLVRQFGDPAGGVQAVQLEFNRRLYQNELTGHLTEGAGRITALLQQIAAAWRAYQVAVPLPLAAE